MNRRKFLGVLGLAPVAACSAALPAIALPKPDRLVSTQQGRPAVDGHPVKLKVRAKDLDDKAEIIFFDDGRILFRAARLDV